MKKILNVGCGNDTYGTDFVDLYPSRKEVLKCDIDNEKLPYPNNSFDEVFSRCLFEHLTKPGFVLKEMYRVLKKGGKLILITDNANYYGFAIGKTHLGDYEGVGSHGKEDKHYSLFTDWHLRNHTQKVGFKNIKTSYIDSSRSSLKFFNFILRITPLKRMSYSRVKLEATK